MRKVAAAGLLSLAGLTAFVAIQRQSAGSGKRIQASEPRSLSSRFDDRAGRGSVVSKSTPPPQASAAEPTVLVEQRGRERKQHPSLAGEAANTAKSIRESSPGAKFDPVLPWAHPGQCLDTSGAAARQRYLASFEIRDTEQRLFVAPSTLESDVQYLRHLLTSTHELATRELGLDAAPPAVYLHSSVAGLREHACVGPAAVAYYDGAIHLAPLEVRYEMKTSLRHEYVHHILAYSGVGKPVWLHEGAAMDFARDAPSGQHSTWLENPINLQRMVEPLSRAASAQDVEIYYAHAAVMFEFLNRLCLGLEPCVTADLVHALTEGGVAPDELFLWATAQRGNELIDQDAIRFWLDYQRHHNFRPDILNRLLSRTLSRAEAASFG